MGTTTDIAWTDHTWNPWIGCQRVSPGCEHCYAEVSTPVRGHRAKGLELWGPPSTTARHRTTSTWQDPARWDRAAAREGVRRRVFVASLSDVFEDHPAVAMWRLEALHLLERCRHLDVQLLTKRPQNVLRMVPPHWRTEWPGHIQIGTTVEDRMRAEDRIRHLLAIPALVRFLSAEPLLEEVDLSPWLADHYACESCGASAWPSCLECNWMGAKLLPRRGLQWVIVGGESGPKARPFNLEWARKIVGQCREAGVPVFVKQMGDNAVIDGARVDYGRHGASPSAWPEDLRVQEFPAT